MCISPGGGPTDYASTLQKLDLTSGPLHTRTMLSTLVRLNTPKAGFAAKLAAAAAERAAPRRILPTGPAGASTSDHHKQREQRPTSPASASTPTRTAPISPPAPRRTDPKTTETGETERSAPVHPTLKKGRARTLWDSYTSTWYTQVQELIPDIPPNTRIILGLSFGLFALGLMVFDRMVPEEKEEVDLEPISKRVLKRDT